MTVAEFKIKLNLARAAYAASFEYLQFIENIDFENLDYELVVIFKDLERVALCNLIDKIKFLNINS